MKVYISSYRDHWVSPYTMVDYMFFWTDWSKCSRNKWTVKDEDWIERPKWTEKITDFLTPVSLAIQWFLDKVHPEVRYVKIDRWDTWSMDHTLAHIVLPMLKQLKASQHGAGYVEDDDVPDELKSTSAPPKENEWDTDGNHFKRWDYVMDEMIFAFESKIDDSWQDEFRSGDIDFKFVPCEDNPTLRTMEHGPNHTYKCDYEGMRKVEERIQNGFRLFGRYYQNLWD